MPFYVLWTYLQLLEMRLISIEYLRALERHSSMRDFVTDTWNFWVSLYGIPIPDNWDGVDDYEEFIQEYRMVIILMSSSSAY